MCSRKMLSPSIHCPAPKSSTVVTTVTMFTTSQFAGSLAKWLKSYENFVALLSQLQTQRWPLFGSQRSGHMPQPSVRLDSWQFPGCPVVPGLHVLHWSRLVAPVIPV
eukprot:COSAG02_NODE_693_length_18428_cov_268.516722_5_plen_107_part_00